MKLETVLAAVSVGDIESVITWYERLFGRACDDRPMPDDNLLTFAEDQRK